MGNSEKNNIDEFVSAIAVEYEKKAKKEQTERQNIINTWVSIIKGINDYFGCYSKEIYNGHKTFDREFTRVYLTSSTDCSKLVEYNFYPITNAKISALEDRDVQDCYKYEELQKRIDRLLGDCFGVVMDFSILVLIKEIACLPQSESLISNRAFLNSREQEGIYVSSSKGEEVVRGTALSGVFIGASIIFRIERNSNKIIIDNNHSLELSSDMVPGIVSKIINSMKLKLKI